jgi:putative ABC transport system permease protein
MKARELVAFAGGALRGHGLRTALTVLGVTIGVASVVLLTALGEGARLYVVGEFASLGSNLVIVVPGKTETAGAAPLVSTAPNDLTVADAEAIERDLRQVRRVAPLVVGTTHAEYGERGRDITVIGTTHAMRPIRQLGVRIGRYLPEGTTSAPVCVLGTKVQQELFGRRNPLGEMIRVGGSRYRVIGIIEPRGTSLGMNLDETVHIPVENALRMFDRTSLFRILSEVRHADLMESAKRDVIRLLTERHRQEDITVITQDAVLSTFGRILTALTMALAAIAAISLTVAGIGIMNVMLVSISERTREIGLLKALGVTRGQVLSIFLAEAIILSSIGGLIGLGVAYAGAGLVRAAAPSFPVQPPIWAVLLALVVSLGVGIAFGLLPARRAMDLDPVQALMRQRQ